MLDSYTALLRTAKVKAHLASQTTRFATERLTALAQATGALVTGIPEVLFGCEQNAGRSQMAAALTAHLSGGRVHVRSAGSSPSSELNPAVVEAMAELGLSMTEAFPKPLTDDVVQAADVVITMGCGDACTIYPGKRYLDWELADPARLSLEGVREVRVNLSPDQVSSTLKQVLSTRPWKYPILITAGSVRSVPSFLAFGQDTHSIPDDPRLSFSLGKCSSIAACVVANRCR